MKTVTERQSVSAVLQQPRSAAERSLPRDGYQAPERLDKAGATASLLCAVHCALMPLVITMLPLVGLSFLADNRIEWALIALSAGLGVTSLCLGYREHRSRRALGVLGLGLTLLALGRILEGQHLGWWGVPLLVLGGTTVAGSHLLNRKLCHDCRRCHPEASTAAGGDNHGSC